MKKTFTKLLTGFAAVLLLLGACGGGGGSSADKLTVGMVTDTGGAHDKSFNQGSVEGIQAYVAENGDKWAEDAPIESSGESDFGTNLKQAATKSDVVLASGFLFQDVIQEVASASPEVGFVGIDIDLRGIDNIPSNLVTYVFAEEQASFLAGVAAAMQTKTNKLGYIGGMPVPAVQKFGWGFVMGAKYVNPEIEVLYEYTGTFDDDALGSQKAKAMFENGVDIIHAAAGQTGVGVIAEAKVQRQNGEDVWVVGVDLDQYDEGKLSGSDESVILTSAIKRLDVAVKEALDSYEDGKGLAGGKTVELTLEQDAVGLPLENPNLSEEILKKVEEVKELIAKGEIVPPTSADEVDTKKVTGKI